jgi:hypothetical protein
MSKNLDSGLDKRTETQEETQSGVQPPLKKTRQDLRSRKSRKENVINEIWLMK